MTDQYQAGYSARFRDEAMCVGATANWQAGWSDANRELGHFEQAFTPFFGTGEEARWRGLPFKPSCSEAWKRGWVEADITLVISGSASE